MYVVAPEYASKTKTELDMFASEAEKEISINAFGKFYDRAVALITAHLIAMSERHKKMGGNAATGQLTGTKVGDLSRQFSKSSDSTNKNGSYDLTIYGVEYLRIRKKILMGPKFVS